ncbi:zinc finger BED domain-containing protein 5-like [Styela clava]
MSGQQKFLEFGFTSINDHGVAKPQCVLCYAVLSNESLKENKLKRHFETKHPQYVEKNRIYFQHREAELKRSRFCSATNPVIFDSKQATLASYVVAQRIAREIKPHTIGERLVKPAAIDMTSLICRDDVASKLPSVSLSNDTQKSHRRPFIEYKKPSGCPDEKSGKWSYQLDESTDTGKYAQVMVYVRYEGELDLEEEFLFCTPLTTTATGADIYNVVDNFHKKEGVDWKNCVSLCTDGASAMLGARQGFTARVNPMYKSSTVFYTVKTL